MTGSVPYAFDGSGSVQSKPISTRSHVVVQAKDAVKVATSNLFIQDQSTIPVDLMTNLIFQDIGGQEIINIENQSTVNSKDYHYSVITNVEDVGNNYDPQSILNLQDTSQRQFDTFDIDLTSHVPTLYTGSTGTLVFDDPNDPGKTYEHVSFEAGTNDLVIWLVDLQDNERVEVEFMTYYNKLNDTIYT
jgi:hypothetical protein